MSQPPIFTRVEQDLAAARQQWDAFRDHWPHRHYHDPQPAATPATEAPMNLIADLKQDAKALAAKFDQVDEVAVTKLEAISANPGAVEVMDTLSKVLHVPAGSFNAAIHVLQDLGEIWAPETDSQAPAAPSDPAMGSAPEAAPEPQPAAV